MEPLTVLRIVDEFSHTFYGDGNGDLQFYFPAIRDGELIQDNPISSYVFITTSVPDSTVIRLENLRIVDSVLCHHGGVGRYRRVIKISDSEVLAMVLSDQDESLLKIGDSVSFIQGTWTGLSGVVEGLEGDIVLVDVELRSRRTHLRVPFDFVLRMG